MIFQRLTLLLVTVATLATFAFASPRTSATRITVTHADGHWAIDYVFDQAVTAIGFGPSVADYRSAHWTVLTTGQTLVAEGGEDRLTADEPFERVSIRVETYEEFPANNYVAASSFSDGGAALFLGFLLGELTLADGTQRAMDAHFDLRAREGERVLVPYQVERGLRVYAYFGSQGPIETEHASLLVDPLAPDWLRESLNTLVPRVTELFTSELDVRLVAKPLIMIGAGRMESQAGYSIKGGAINGHIMITLRGRDLHDEAQRDTFEKLLVHEVAHLWQEGPGTTAIGRADPWIHEGGADALAVSALQQLGRWDADKAQAFGHAAVNRCTAQLAQRSLAEIAESGEWGAVYDCGYMMFSETGLDVFELWAALIKAAVRSGEPLSQALFERVLADEF